MTVYNYPTKEQSLEIIKLKIDEIKKKLEEPCNPSKDYYEGKLTAYEDIELSIKTGCWCVL